MNTNRQSKFPVQTNGKLLSSIRVDSRSIRGSAFSIALDAICQLAYGRGKSGLGNDAEWPLALAFGVLLVRALLGGKTTAVLNDNTAETVGVVVGFNSGDCILVGELNEEGFYFVP